jgi:vacuolar-type H+-ATPase subunit E/Vma4
MSVGVAEQLLDSLAQQLEPVRRSLLAEADRDAEAIVERAAAEAEAVVDRARSEAAEATARVRDRASAARRARSERDRARVTAETDRRILATRAQLRQRLVAAARDAVGDLRGHPRYRDLLDRLEDLARSQLGDGATVDRDPAPDGGVTAAVGNRRVDYTLAALADRALDDLADEVAAPWN